MQAGWTAHYEDWSVCIKGDNAGEVLAGITWEIDQTGAKLVDESPASPSKHFKDAVKSWEKWFDAQGPKPFTEPGGGFRF